MNIIKLYGKYMLSHNFIRWGIMINEIKKINGFRGIKELKKPVPLSKFNVIIGKNNSGKTSLLESLYLFPNPNRNCIYPKHGSVLDFISSLGSGKKSLIYGYNGTSEIELNIYYNNSNHIWKSVITSDGISNVYLDEDLYYGEYDMIFKNVYFPYCSIPNNAINILLSSSENEQIFRNQYDTIISSISEILDEKISNIVIKDNGCYIGLDETSLISIYDIGGGMKKIILTVIVLEVIKPKIVIFDNFDSSLHPSIISRLLRYLLRKDCQIVLSTHSIDVLYNLLDMDDNDYIQVISLKKDKNDVISTNIYTVDEPGLKY